MVSKALPKFVFKGSIPASRTLMSRALIIKSFFSNFGVNGQSNSSDVVTMVKAVDGFLAEQQVDCGESEMVLRSMALRASREPGMARISGHPKMFQKSHDDLLFLLTQLGVRAEVLPNEILIDSMGWKKPLTPVRIHRSKSSQFATSILLNSWKLPFALDFELAPAGIYDPYWNMTLNFAANMGMSIEQRSRDHFVIPANQYIRERKADVEPDFCSIFTIAAIAALSGEARIEGVPTQSIQGDFECIEMMKKMKIPVTMDKNTLVISKAANLIAGEWIMKDNPDLLPVLAILMAHAQGRTNVTGPTRTLIKQSARLKKTAELLKLMGIPSEITENGISFEGKGFEIRKTSFEFDPEQDHRLCMAVGILIRLGWNVTVKNREIVSRNFPDYWKILGV